jgi:hypothetical protein
MSTDDVLDADRLRRLLSAGRSLVADLDLESVLDRVLQIAREVTGACYAALGSSTSAAPSSSGSSPPGSTRTRTGRSATCPAGAGSSWC